MPTIPTYINGVELSFSPLVNRNVDVKIVNALNRVISPTIASDYKLSKVYISSANDQHVLPSRHVQGEGKAVDISRINGKKMSIYYPSDSAVKAIVDAMQTKFELYPHRRENFGPLFTRKLGSGFTVSGHKDHIHFSVN